VVVLALLNVVLIYVVAAQWLQSRPLAIFAAAALALTPAHFILGREAADYFCPTTVALLWLADKVDEQLDRYREEHGIGTTWEARERVVVALTGGRDGDTLIRRAERIAAGSKGADLLGVHV
jgi:hypothetical protein